MKIIFKFNNVIFLILKTIVITIFIIKYLFNNILNLNKLILKKFLNYLKIFLRINDIYHILFKKEF